MNEKRNSTSISLSPTLEIRDLHVWMSRGGKRKPIIEGLDICAYPGEITALVGRSGSGKSTLAHAIQGLLPHTNDPVVTGSICIKGHEIAGAGAPLLRFVRKRFVRVISQDPLDALNPTMTVRRQMAETCDKRTAAERLRWAGIADVDRVMRSFPHQISGGERQRVLIAMATAEQVALIVADEPTTGLDPDNKAKVITLLRALAADGTAVLMCTHDLGVAELSDRIAIMETGRIVEFGSTSAVFANPLHPYTTGLLAIRYDGITDRSKPLPTLRRANGETSDQLTRSVVEESAPWPNSSSSTGEIVLDMRDVSKAFHKRGLLRSPSVDVLKSVSMTVRSGECVALIGESGVGKSTFLKIAAGLLRQDFGTVRWKSTSNCQFVFQEPKSFLTPWLPVGEQIVEGLRSQRLDAPARNIRLMEMLDFVGLERSVSEALPFELSIGQCQRAVIARALAISPSLLLCDEPISALDTSLAASILNLLGHIRRTYGTAIIMATHDLAAARIAADRVYALRDGRLHSLSEVTALRPERRFFSCRATLPC